MDNCNTLSHDPRSKVVESLVPEKMYMMDDTKKGSPFVEIHPISHSDAKIWFHVLEITLLMYQWLMSPFHDHNTIYCTKNRRRVYTESRSQTKLRQCMAVVKLALDDRCGHGLKIMKFHQISTMSVK